MKAKKSSFLPREQKIMFQSESEGVMSSRADASSPSPIQKVGEDWTPSSKRVEQNSILSSEDFKGIGWGQPTMGNVMGLLGNIKHILI